MYLSMVSGNDSDDRLREVESKCYCLPVRSNLLHNPHHPLLCALEAMELPQCGTIGCWERVKNMSCWEKFEMNCQERS